ncbi:MAG: endonuclease MutS2 [Bacteroidetes bacterium]|nr:endonuclease MutS2 [Bacteroidota bacterium]MBT5529604.1 endonuclease MutS2 [Cytophagia bacterium]MBT3935211.1 endonuclease MutS2 [Bacteroidota bacterium]MBT4339990.1 endonuclease MutS2 [Bacteroidota bacterium]MBT5992420.1 endonuclease MutS2 [Bacteroidota bacterium]
MEAANQTYFETYPADLEQKLEFNQIRALLAELCISELGIKQVENIKLLTSKDLISRLLDETSEFKYILEQAYSFPTVNYLDIAQALKILSIQGSTLEASEFYRILLFLLTVQKIFKFFTKYQAEIPVLNQIILGSEFNEELISKLDSVLAEGGDIKNNASKELSDIRKKINKTQSEMEQRFQKVLSYCRNNKWLHDEEQSVRRGDRVLAIDSKYKRKVKGLILDESATGKTAFIQPEEVVELNYKLYELFQQEKKEIQRILRELSDYYNPYVSLLSHYQFLLGRFDLIRAKAKLAVSLHAIAPKLADTNQTELVDAFHPLLFLKNTKLKKKTISLNLKLDTDKRILIISGPNAGGKSVCLKTVGLNQLMLQAGMLIPVHPNSCMGIYKQLFVDIGDNQSIDNDLSTYTSKLSYMKHFLENSSANALILIDEFGSGTDPQIGGIIAETMLENLNEKKAFGIITTHYTNLKVYAAENEGMLNGAMLFDLDTYSPTYHLEIGRPGSSYAFELVQKIGFGNTFIKRIRSKIQTNELNLDSLLVRLQEEMKQVEMQSADILKQKKQADQLIEENRKLKYELTESKSKILQETQEKAKKYLDNTNKHFDKLINQWQSETNTELKSEKKKEIQVKLQQEKEVVQKQEKKQKKPKPLKINKSNIAVQVGHQVVLDDRTDIGMVESIDKKKAVVIFGNIRAKVELERLLVVENKDQPSMASKPKLIVSTERDNSFSPVMDVRGQRRDEALLLTEKFIDDALLHHYKSLRIIHGHGDGILRAAIRDSLKNYNFIAEVKSESAQNGGEGVTIVELE